MTPPLLSPNMPVSLEEPELPVLPDEPVEPLAPVGLATVAPLKPAPRIGPAPTVAVALPPIPGAAMPAAEPRPAAIPLSSCPKGKWVLVLGWWMMRQSDLPVRGSVYFWRRKRTLLVFSRASIEGG